MPKISKPKKDKVLPSPKPLKKKAPAKTAVAAPAPAVPAPGSVVSASGEKITPEERHRMVAEAAYYIALKKGFNSDPSENWFEAEKQVDDLLKADGRL